jgi:hypothetical protein
MLADSLQSLYRPKQVVEGACKDFDHFSQIAPFEVVYDARC